MAVEEVLKPRSSLKTITAAGILLAFVPPRENGAK